MKERSLVARVRDALDGRELTAAEVAARLGEPVKRVRACMVKQAGLGRITRVSDGVYVASRRTRTWFDPVDDALDEFLTCFDDTAWRGMRHRDALFAE